LNKDYYLGDRIEIIINNNSDTNKYIQEARWNESVLEYPTINHGDLTRGGVLELDMGHTPGKNITFSKIK